MKEEFIVMLNVLCVCGFQGGRCHGSRRGDLRTYSWIGQESAGAVQEGTARDARCWRRCRARTARVSTPV